MIHSPDPSPTSGISETRGLRYCLRFREVLPLPWGQLAAETGEATHILPT